MLRTFLVVLFCNSAPQAHGGCAPSEKHISEDIERRQCLRQCEIPKKGSEEEGATTASTFLVQPPFEEWEEFCYETSLLDNWDKNCEQFYCCLYGCKVFGSDRSKCHDAAVEQRPSLLERARIANNEKSDRCDIQKCRAWCAREVFETCKEKQYEESCKYDTAGLFRCDVKCDGAWRTASHSMMLLSSLLLLHGACAW